MAPITSVDALPLSRSIAQSLLDRAAGYGQWQAAAAALDALDVPGEWKRQAQSSSYDAGLLAARLQQLRGAREARDMAKLAFLLRTALSRNLADMGNARLYAVLRTGTKQLVEDYIREVEYSLDALLLCAGDVLPDEQRLECLTAARQAFGRTALLLSGGAMLGLSHIGVIKALLGAQLLPRVLSGSSAGAIVAAVCCTHTDDEIPAIIAEFPFADFNVFSHPHRPESLLARLGRFLKHGAPLPEPRLTARRLARHRAPRRRRARDAGRHHLPGELPPHAPHPQHQRVVLVAVCDAAPAQLPDVAARPRLVRRRRLVLAAAGLPPRRAARKAPALRRARPVDRQPHQHRLDRRQRAGRHPHRAPRRAVQRQPLHRQPGQPARRPLPQPLRRPRPARRRRRQAAAPRRRRGHAPARHVHRARHLQGRLHKAPLHPQPALLRRHHHPAPGQLQAPAHPPRKPHPRVPPRVPAQGRARYMAKNQHHPQPLRHRTRARQRRKHPPQEHHLPAVPLPALPLPPPVPRSPRRPAEHQHSYPQQRTRRPRFHQTYEIPARHPGLPFSFLLRHDYPRTLLHEKIPRLEKRTMRYPRRFLGTVARWLVRVI
ncbi:Lipase 5 [Neolecta irregularis DAH-3]|uniref:Lipase 5 n=1 Tax=Neolecta irregularis (strain DAH-3) TaxID=1198029 RepID=A0A1U7LM14_NEOID|nr:Lipase 5 [Neolecta irregularis DAH-3]|eukprot:OLL23695.1 Lipase 5 [Neolecta irregularis DAH-3]